VVAAASSIWVPPAPYVGEVAAAAAESFPSVADLQHFMVCLLWTSLVCLLQAFFDRNACSKLLFQFCSSYILDPSTKNLHFADVQVSLNCSDNSDDPDSNYSAAR
jgi:hypothetical protein